MGRKIPAKKHRGVKDPLVQQAKRLASLKGKINAPPKDPDEQPVPKSLTRLFAFQDPYNKRKNITQKKNLLGRLQSHGKDSSAGGSVHNPISRLRMLPGESGRGFSLRINSAVKALHNPAEELHYPLDIEAEDEKGMRMSEQRERRARKRRKAARAQGAPPHQDQEPHFSRTQKLALKKKAKKMKASEVSQERREVQYERVSFGDVTHAPPALHFHTGAARPGKRDLLLNSLLVGGNKSNTGNKSNKSNTGNKSNNPAEQQRRERARLAAVAAYRALKAANMKNK